MRKDFQFEPLQRGVIWAKLSLTAGQVAELAGVSQRQVTYGKRRGFLVAAGTNPERLNGTDVDLCVLMKQPLNAGIPLRRAVDMAHDYLQDELMQQAGLPNFSAEELTDVREKLVGASSSIDLVLSIFDQLADEAGLPAERDEADTAALT